MLKIIFYCYSRGIITSRPMEYACKANMAVKALAQDAEPDHATIAYFISSQAEAVKELFSQVLTQCYALGLIGGDHCPRKKVLSYKGHVELNQNFHFRVGMGKPFFPFIRGLVRAVVEADKKKA